MTNDPQRKRRRLIGIGFVLAFALSTATLILTGLNVRAPGTARSGVAPEDDPPSASTARDSTAEDPDEREAAPAETEVR